MCLDLIETGSEGCPESRTGTLRVERIDMKARRRPLPRAEEKCCWRLEMDIGGCSFGIMAERI